MGAQPLDRVVRIALVVLQVRGVPWPGFADARPLVAKGGQLSNAAQDIAHAIHDVQRLDFLPKPVVRAVPLKVQFAD